MQAHRSIAPSLRSHVAVRPLLAVALASLGAFAGTAQAAPDDLQRVEITGRRPGETVHTDVRRACPGIEASLHDSLSKVQYRVQREGVTTVSFRLNGADPVSELNLRGGPVDYRQPLRRAMSQLNCKVAGEHQLYAVQIAFRNESSDEFGVPRDNVALLGE